MIHQRERLPLDLETGDDALGVHAQLDDLERHAAADRFQLLGQVHDPAPALADLLQQLVAAHPVSGFPGGRNGPHRGSLAVEPGGRRFQKIAGLPVGAEQRLELAVPRGVARANGVEIGGALPGRQLQCRVEEGHFGIQRLVHRWFDDP